MKIWVERIDYMMALEGIISLFLIISVVNVDATFKFMFLCSLWVVFLDAILIRMWNK